MKRITKMVMVGVLVVVLAGCGYTAKNVQQKTFNTRTGVFTELGNGEIPERNFAVVIIKASLKTHVEGYYWLESKDSPCGKARYPFIFNIAGQTVLWNTQGQKECLPCYDQDGKTSHDPDAGEGVKYILDKKIKIRPGTYKWVLDLPNENFSREVEISLQGGKSYFLEFKPVYKEKTLPTRIPNFIRGIKGYQVYLDGFPL